MTEVYKIAVLLGIFLCAVSSAAHGVSVSCMMSYDEGGAPAVFQSPNCPQWVLSMDALKNQTGNCQFATLQGHRRYQEDYITCNLDMKIPVLGKDGPKEVTVGVVAVFDGHGGKEASEMASKSLLDYFFLHVIFNIYKQALPYNKEHDLASQGVCNDESEHQILHLGSSQGALPVIDDELLRGILKEALLRTIHDIDSKFYQEALNNKYISGSTATVVLLVDGQFLVSSLGDSKALLCSKKIQPRQLDTKGTSATKLYTEELTTDHHPDRADEKARIEESGGFVRLSGAPRVNGILAVSRAIGDVYLKRYGVIAVPEMIDWRPVTANDSYLVVASDGIFESLTPQNVCDLLDNAYIQENDTSKRSSSCLSSSSMADCIGNTALKRGSTDNLSVIVVPLRSDG